MNKNIYGMKLHEEKKINQYTIVVRIAGGWIYIFPKENTSNFVPFNSEFQDIEKSEKE